MSRHSPVGVATGFSIDPLAANGGFFHVRYDIVVVGVTVTSEILDSYGRVCTQ